MRVIKAIEATEQLHFQRTAVNMSGTRPVRKRTWRALYSTLDLGDPPTQSSARLSMMYASWNTRCTRPKMRFLKEVYTIPEYSVRLPQGYSVF